jgi:hypothetical protein
MNRTGNINHDMNVLSDPWDVEYSSEASREYVGRVSSKA